MNLQYRRAGKRFRRDGSRSAIAQKRSAFSSSVSPPVWVALSLSALGETARNLTTTKPATFSARVSVLQAMSNAVCCILFVTSLNPQLTYTDSSHLSAVPALPRAGNLVRGILPRITRKRQYHRRWSLLAGVC